MRRNCRQVLTKLFEDWDVSLATNHLTSVLIRIMEFLTTFLQFQQQ